MRSVYGVAVLAVLIAVASSLGYGIADFTGGLATRGAPVLRVVVITMPASLVVLGVLAPVLGGHWSAAALGWGALAGVASAAGFALLYQCLALGPMGVLSPITAVVSAVLPAAVGLTEGEPLTGPGMAGIALAIVAVIAVSAGPAARRPSAAALGLAFAAGAAIAAMLVCLSKSPHDSGMFPLIACRVVSTAAAFAVLGCRRAALRGAGRPDVRLAAAAGAFDGLANVAFLVAVRSGSLVVVAVITALYPGATVLLARRVLGERLTGMQLAGLAVAAAAVTILAIGSPG
jgi:drug/metabolite transporter (DMT)-like permease